MTTLSPDPALAEHELRGLVRGVGLVGELDLAPDGRTAQLARATLQQLLERGGSCSRIARLYPSVTVVYLVSQGIYRYNHGGFWTELDLAGIEPNEMGPGFIAALKQLHLETFEHVKPDGAYSKITPILLHGGIPRFCARDVLQLLVNEMRQGGADATEIIARWVHSPSRMFAVDRPAQRFLTHGGEQAVDLFERLIAMVNVASGGGEPDADALALPAYLVEEFLRLPPASRKVRTQGSLLPTPHVQLDYTTGNGPELLLPTVAGRLGAREWVLVAGRQHRFPVSTTSERIVPLPEAPSWEVNLVDLVGVVRASTFRGAAGTRVFFFDPSSQQLLRSQDRLAVDTVVALAPAGFAFRSGGEHGPEVPLADTELPPLEGAWRWYEARHLDLRGVSELWVGSAAPTGLSTASAIVRVTGPSQRPTLVGEPCEAVTGADGRPVYGAPPQLRVPGADAGDLHRWRLRLAVNGQAMSAPLSDFPSTEGVVDLRQAIGVSIATVELDVIGPLGSDLRGAQFHVVPGLEVEQPDHVLRPSQPASLLVVTSDSVAFDGGAPGGHTLHVPAEADTVRATATDDARSLELVFSVPRLMWAMRRSGDGTQPFATTRIELSSDDLSSDDVLLVRTRRRSHLTLQLAVGDEVLQELPRVDTVGCDGRWAFALTPLIGTITRAERPWLQLRLLLDGIAVPVAEVVTTYLATVERAESLADAGAEVALLSLVFSENRPFKHRQARLWSVDRPWERPRVMPIDDDVDGSGGVILTVHAPPGRYLVDIGLGDDWTTPRRPPGDAPGLGVVSLGGHFDLTRYLASLDRTNPLHRLQLLLTGDDDNFEWSEDDLVVVAPYAVMAVTSLLDELGAKAINDRRFEQVAPLLERTDALLRGVSAAIDDGLVDPDALTPLVITCLPRLLDHLVEHDELVARRGHRLHPILGALLDPAYVDDPAAGARWTEYLGWCPDDPDPARAYPFKGGPVDEQWLRLSRERLRTIQLSLDLTHDQPLAEGGFISAMFEWLVAMCDGATSQVLQWEARYRQLNDARPAKLSEQHRLFLEAVKPQGLGLPPTARFPYDLLAAAIQLVSIHSSRLKATSALLDAARIAPKLVDRSLLVAIVLERG